MCVCVCECVCVELAVGGCFNILAAGPVYIEVLVGPREVRLLGRGLNNILRELEAIGRQLHDSFSLIGH